MVNLDLLKKSIPVAPLKIAALPGCERLSETVDKHLAEYRQILAKEKSGLPSPVILKIPFDRMRMSLFRNRRGERPYQGLGPRNRSVHYV